MLFCALLSGGTSAAPTSHIETKPDYSSVELQPTGFPALTDNSLILPLEQLAQGTLPNGPAPPRGAISADGITNLQLIELNEFFETAFFASLLSNVTKNVPGYEISDHKERQVVIDALVAIIAVSTAPIHRPEC